MKNRKNRVLAVDLDGTLVQTDLLHESIVALLKKNPFYIIKIFVWLFLGKAYLKQAISERIEINVSSLPFNRELIEFLKKEKANGK